MAKEADALEIKPFHQRILVHQCVNFHFHSPTIATAFSLIWGEIQCPRTYWRNNGKLTRNCGRYHAQNRQNRRPLHVNWVTKLATLQINRVVFDISTPQSIEIVSHNLIALPLYMLKRSLFPVQLSRIIALVCHSFKFAKLLCRLLNHN